MEELKRNVERLNNLFFKLHGMYSGALECLEDNGVCSEEVKFLAENNPSFVDKYLEELDEYVIEKINHGLDCDSFLLIETHEQFSDLNPSELYNASTKFNVEMLKELRDIEQTLYSYIPEHANLGVCCECIRSSLDQTNESLHIIDGRVKGVKQEPEC